ncbi:hypothetical protein GGI00_002871, partial [Coemansia sp. RSA 2681]
MSSNSEGDYAVGHSAASGSSAPQDRPSKAKPAKDMSAAMLESTPLYEANAPAARDRQRIESLASTGPSAAPAPIAEPTPEKVRLDSEAFKASAPTFCGAEDERSSEKWTRDVRKWLNKGLQGAPDHIKLPDYRPLHNLAIDLYKAMFQNKEIGEECWGAYKQLDYVRYSVVATPAADDEDSDEYGDIPQKLIKGLTIDPSSPTNEPVETTPNDPFISRAV